MSVLVVLVVGSFALLLWGSAAVHDAYDEEPMWLVAPYAEPFRSVVGVALCVGVGLAVGQGARAAPATRRQQLVVVVVLGASIALALELSSAVYYDQISGQLFVATPLGHRSEFDFSATQDGVCVEAMVDGRFWWEVNGDGFVPRFLPLPRRDGEVRAALKRLPPDACPTAIER